MEGKIEGVKLALSYLVESERQRVKSLHGLDLLHESERRWLYDAEHHAAVETVAQVVNAGKGSVWGGRQLTDDEWALARLAASVALTTHPGSAAPA